MYIRQITNKNLLDSIGDSTQYSVTTHMRKESEKEWINAYIELNHFVVHLKLTQHSKSTKFQYNFLKKK